MKTQTLLIIAGVGLAGFLLLNMSKGSQQQSGTGINLGFDDQGNVTNASLGLGFLDDLFTA